MSKSSGHLARLGMTNSGPLTTTVLYRATEYPWAVGGWRELYLPGPESRGRRNGGAGWNPTTDRGFAGLPLSTWVPPLKNPSHVLQESLNQFLGCQISTDPSRTPGGPRLPRSAILNQGGGVCQWVDSSIDVARTGSIEVALQGAETTETQTLGQPTNQNHAIVATDAISRCTQQIEASNCATRSAVSGVFQLRTREGDPRTGGVAPAGWRPNRCESKGRSSEATRTAGSR
jgi:hypothetical protein